MAEVRETKSAFGIPLIVGAIGFGLAAALMSFIYLKSEKAALLQKYAGSDRKEVTVLVAAKDLPKGSVVREEVLSQRRIPSGFVANDAIAAADYQKYLGRVLESDVGAGKPLLTSYLDTRFPVDFSDIVPIGRRAMTIQVDDLNAVAGFIRPGNHIDLFVNIPSALSGFSAGFITANMIDSIPAELRNAIPPALLEAARGANTSDATVKDLLANAIPKELILPVLQNVRVLATGRDPYQEELDQLAYPQPRAQRTFNSLTLDLTPREAALVTSALKKGDMLAMLRNRNDNGAADFSTLSAQDLFSNAFKMAKSEGDRRQRVAMAGGVDRAGNLVDASGNTIMNQAQLRAAGLSVNDKGQLVDKNGRVIDAKDVVVTADGRVLEKSALAAAGLSVNASGQLVDKNGKVVAADAVVMTAGGKVMTKEQLKSAHLSVNDAGEVVDASGRVVDTAKMVTTANGRVLTTEQLSAAGLSVNDKGEIVDASGKVVDPSKLVVSANGQILSHEQLAAAGLKVNDKGQLVDASGKVVDPATLVADANGKVLDGKTLAAAGLSVNDAGQVVDKSGNVVEPAALVATRDGAVVSQAQLAAAGLKLNDKGEVVDGKGHVLSRTEIAAVAAATPIGGNGSGGRSIGFIIGGSPSGGVAKSTTLKVTD
jgi:pilus assembly protein CpaB